MSSTARPAQLTTAGEGDDVAGLCIPQSRAGRRWGPARWFPKVHFQAAGSRGSELQSTQSPKPEARNLRPKTRGLGQRVDEGRTKVSQGKSRVEGEFVDMTITTAVRSNSM